MRLIDARLEDAAVDDVADVPVARALPQVRGFGAERRHPDVVAVPVHDGVEMVRIRPGVARRPDDPLERQATRFPAIRHDFVGARRDDQHGVVGDTERMRTADARDSLVRERSQFVGVEEHHPHLVTAFDHRQDAPSSPCDARAAGHARRQSEVEPPGGRARRVAQKQPALRGCAQIAEGDQDARRHHPTSTARAPKRGARRTPARARARWTRAAPRCTMRPCPTTAANDRSHAEP